MDKRLVWLALGTFAIGVEGFVIATLLPAISTDLGVSISQAGYLVFAYAIAYAIGSPVLSAVTGQFDRRALLAVVAVVFGSGALFAALSQGYGMLLLARVIIAACAGLYAATAQATAVSLAPVERRARAVSLVVAGTTMAVAFGAPIGALVSGVAGWRGTYFAIAVVGYLTAIAIWFMLPAGIKGDRRSIGERLAVLSVPGILPALLTILLYMVGPFAAFVYLGPITTKGMGLAPGLLPYVMLSFGVGAAIGNTLGGQLADRLGATRTVVFASVASAVMLVLLSAIPMLPAGVVGPVYFIFMFVWGVVAWTFLPAQVSRLVAMAPTSAPLALSLNASSLYLGTALGAVVGGQVIEQLGVNEIGLVAAAFPVLALLVLYASRPSRALQMPRLG
ncbi:MFS transporter [Devosia sp.]|uniref:MFS transporter n=1 Tax=Devosia sp. TaxID=1871048 RepID=UPI003BA8D3B5